MLDFFSKLFDTQGFPARWDCGSAWTPEHGWLHICSDIAIWGAYTAIPVVLFWFALRRGDLPFLRIFWLFGAFILACGTGHLIESIIFWHPVYRLSGLVKFATAVVSWGTVIALVQTIPKAMAYPGVATLMDQLRQERGQAARALTENQRRLQVALDAGGMGVWEWDFKTDAVFLDRRELMLCGLSDQWALTTGESFFGNVHPEDLPRLRSAVKDAQERGEYAHEFRFVVPGGQIRWLAGRGVVLPADETHNRRMIGVNYDVTPLKLGEEALRQATRAANAANEAKSAFLANVSHEIRTPMTAILGYARLLESGEPNLDRNEALATIVQSGEHLLALINDILDLSKVEAGELPIERVRFAPLELIEEVARTLRIRAAEKGLSVEVLVDSPLPATIEGDPLRLRQILTNLAGNAIKFTVKGGVKIRTRLSVDGPTRLVIAFEDTGPGIAEEDLERIFEPFTQLAPTADGRGGTGLGLAISRRLVERIGGELTAASTLGQGSTFTVSLPVGSLRGIPLEDSSPDLSDDVPSSNDGADSIHALAAPCRVLLVEDTAANRKLLGIILSKVGAEVTEAENGLRALEMMLRQQELGQAFDVVLMDMAMPELDGFETTKQLRAAEIKTPIIALTAHAMAEDRQRCLAAGCDDYLTKPVDREALLRAIQKSMSARASADGP